MKARLCVPLLRPIRGGTFGGVRTPRVPLLPVASATQAGRATRGYSPLPLSEQGKGRKVVLRTASLASGVYNGQPHS